MTDPQPAPAALMAEWQAFIDAKFPVGMWVEDVSDTDRAQRRLLPSVVVMELVGDYPVLIGQDFTRDMDFTLVVTSWTEVEVGGHYAARVQGEDRPWELRSGVPPVLRQPTARQQARVDREILEERRQLQAKSRLAKLIDEGKTPPPTADVEGDEAALSAPLLDEETGVAVPGPVAAARRAAA